ncbi:MAG: IgGFc-binding protein [Paludibacteraceae bacterium]
MNRYSKLTPLLSIRRSLCKMLLAGGLLLSAASLLSAQNASHDGQSTEGTDFWVTFLRADDDNPTELSLRFATKEATDVKVENTYTGYSETLSLAANTLGTLVVDKQHCYVGTADNEKVSNHALHITATANISLIAANYRDKSFDVAAILPTASLRDEYRVQCYTPADHESKYQGSHFAIVATEDNTVVDYAPTVGTDSLNAFLSALSAWNDEVFERYPTYERYRNYTSDGTIVTDTLQAGEVWYVWTGNRQGESADLSGTYIKARDGKQIAVFNGNPHTNIPTVRDRDHIYSQAMPTEYWGSQFAITSSLTTIEGQTGSWERIDKVRIMALNDETTVYIDGDSVYTFDFATNPKHFYEFDFGAKDAKTNYTTPVGLDYYEGASHYITTSCPCAVHMFMTSNRYDHADKPYCNGDPSELWVNPIEQQISEITFGTFETAQVKDHFLNIVTTQNNTASITLDGAEIGPLFAPLHGNPAYAFARIKIENGTHTLKADSGFIANVYGFGEKESYSYPAGGATKTLTSSITINGKEFTADSNNLICGIDEVNFGCSLNYNFEKIVWGFGDGTAPYTDNGPDSVSNVTHLYEKDGVYDAYALVYRTSTNLCEGQSAMDSIPIKVNIGRFTFSMGEPEIPCNNGVDAWIGRIPFNNESGTDLESDNTTIEFDANAIAAGFSNADLVLRDSHFEINIPDGATVGTEYGIHIVITSECGGTDTTLYFQLNYDADVLSQRADNVLGLLAEPFEGDELSGFQWYSIDAAGDTTAIDGQVSATLNWYDLPADQYNGNTYFLCFYKNRGTEKEVRTCTCDKGFTGDDGDLVFEIPDITIVQQNMAHIGERIFVNAKLPSTLTWLTVDGTAYATEDIPAGGRTVEVPDREGFYILRIATLAEKKKDVQTRNFKFLVTK